MSQHVEIVKWYTRARRFPRLVGRTHTGGKIWGGPYTITQVIGAVIIVVILLNTTALWAHGSLLTNVFILTGITYAGVFTLGKIPPDARNPLSVAVGALGALISPREGRRAGAALRHPRPQRVRTRITLDPTTNHHQVPLAPAETPHRGAPASTTRHGVVTEQPAALAPTPTPVVPTPRRPRPAPTGLEQALARTTPGRSR